MYLQAKALTLCFEFRLVTQDEKADFLKIVQSTCKSHLKSDLGKCLGKHVPQGVPLSDDVLRGLMFGNYMEPDADPRVYDEVDNLNKAERMLNYYLNEFNAKSTKPMDLVLFRFAIEHISRSVSILIVNITPRHYSKINNNSRFVY